MIFGKRGPGQRQSIPTPGHYTIELTSIGDSEIFYRLRVRWSAETRPAWRCWYRKTWKYKIITNAMNRMQTLIDRYGLPSKTTILGFEVGLRVAAARRSPPGNV